MIAANICHSSAGKLVSIETADAMARLQRIVINDNILNGADVLIRVATLTSGGHIESVSIANNIIATAGPVGCLISEHTGGQITNLLCSGNVGPPPKIEGNVNLLDDHQSSRNADAGATASAPPRQGAWPLGAIIFNSAPGQGAPVGWVCTAAGTPGTWNGFGSIGAPV
jgi:hypothetical protein